MALRYPSMPSGGVDAGSIIDMFNSGYDRSKARADERKAVDAFGGYLDSVYTNQGAPQSLAALGGLLQSPAAGQVQRSPLPAPTDPATARVEQAFAAQGQGRAPTDLNSNAIAGRFLKTIRDGGVTNPFALAAIAATGKRESGFDPKNAVRTWSDPSQSGQAGTAGGIMSWRNERLQALQQFAQQNGDDPRAPSPETQAKYLLAEDPTLIQKLQNAGSAEEAQQLMNNAWRYAGYNQQGGETAERMALAGQYAQQFGGSPSQQALEGMAVGQSMPMGQGVQMADASGQMMPQGQLPPLPDRETMLQLFANPITRPLAIQAAQSRIEAMQGQNDPMARVKYQTAVAQLQKIQRGGDVNYGLTPIYGKDAQGNTVLGTVGNDGTFKRIDTGDFTPSTGTGTVDLGTSIGTIDKRTGQVISTVEKNLADAEAEKVRGKDEGEARALYDSMISKMPGLRQTVERLDELTEKATYTWAGRAWDEARKQFGMDPRSEAVARSEYTAIVDNQILPLLRDTFGAQFTAAEGDRLRETLGDPNKSPGEKKALLKAFIEQKERDIEGLARRTGQGATPDSGWQDIGGVKIRRKQ